jgi:hypothetical protein
MPALGVEAGDIHAGLLVMLIQAALRPGVECGPQLVGVDVVLGVQGLRIGRGAVEVSGPDGIQRLRIIGLALRRWPLTSVRSDDHIDKGWIIACLVLAIAFDCRGPQSGVRARLRYAATSLGGILSLREVNKDDKIQGILGVRGFFGFRVTLQRTAGFHDSIRQSNWC